MSTTYYLAVDIGASSGRHILGWLENGKIQLEEVYRFPNGMTDKNGCLCWDYKALTEHVINGIARCKEIGKIPSYMGIDTWGERSLPSISCAVMLLDRAALSAFRTPKRMTISPSFLIVS